MLSLFRRFVPPRVCSRQAQCSHVQYDCVRCVCFCPFLRLYLHLVHRKTPIPFISSLHSFDSWQPRLGLVVVYEPVTGYCSVWCCPDPCRLDAPNKRRSHVTWRLSSSVGQTGSSAQRPPLSNPFLFPFPLSLFLSRFLSLFFLDR